MSLGVGRKFESLERQLYIYVSQTQGFQVKYRMPSYNWISDKSNNILVKYVSNIEWVIIIINFYCLFICNSNITEFWGVVFIFALLNLANLPNKRYKFWDCKKQESLPNWYCGPLGRFSEHVSVISWSRGGGKRVTDCKLTWG